MNRWVGLAVILVAFALWLAVYRLPFRRQTVANRVGLALSPYLRMSRDTSFAVFATAWYAGFGLLAGVSILLICGTTPTPLLGDLGVAKTASAFVLAGVGMVGITATLTSPMVIMGIDVPSLVERVTWVKRTESLPGAARAAPIWFGALVEEFVFRGVILSTLAQLGFGLFASFMISTVLFCGGQFILAGDSLSGLLFFLTSVAISLPALLILAGGGYLVPLLVHTTSAAMFLVMSDMQSAGGYQPGAPVGRR